MLKNIKSVLAVIVAAVMLFSAAGCSGNNGDTSLENSRDGLLDANVSEAFQKPDAPETENQTVESNTEEDIPSSSESENKVSEQNTNTETESNKNNEQKEETPVELVDATLIVNGKDITAGHYVKINKTYRYAEVPFLAVLEELGAKIEQIDEINVKIIIYNDKENLSDANIKDIYILDTQNVFLAHGKYTENEDGSFTFDNNYIYEKDYAQKQPINFFYILCGQCPPFFHAVINGEFISDTLSAKYVIRTLSHDFFIDYNNNTVSVESIN